MHRDAFQSIFEEAVSYFGYSVWFIILDLPQLRRAPIKFGWFIELKSYNININIFYKQADGASLFLSLRVQTGTKVWYTKSMPVDP